VDLLGGNELGGEDEVALVLAVLVVHQNDDLAAAHGGDDVGNRADGGGFPAHGPILRAQQEVGRAGRYFCAASCAPSSAGAAAGVSGAAAAAPVSMVAPMRSRMRADLPERSRR